MSIGATATIIGMVLIIAVMVAAALAEHRKRVLRTSFGPEYDRLLKETGSARDADREMLRRRRAHESLTLAPLEQHDVSYFRTGWDHVQGGFLDDPATSLAGAENLIANLLDARGYPGDDPEERVALLSVAHPETMAAYREAAAVADQHRQDPAAVSTEDMRNALMRFHEIFEDLLMGAGAAANPRISQESQESEARA